MLAPVEPRQILQAGANCRDHVAEIVVSGSPAGNGGVWQRWLRPGDVLEAAISGIGAQRNTCVSGPVT
ncbi:hypothetical protein BJF90_00015 [Pseudonocardia sp. CNS-004]|nr:hypothetical protein BJF90_00015 [Pseudonocardia sp. CNS-004]